MFHETLSKSKLTNTSNPKFFKQEKLILYSIQLSQHIVDWWIKKNNFSSCSYYFCCLQIAICMSLTIMDIRKEWWSFSVLTAVYFGKRMSIASFVLKMHYLDFRPCGVKTMLITWVCFITKYLEQR